MARVQRLPNIEAVWPLVLILVIMTVELIGEVLYLVRVVGKYTYFYELKIYE